MNAVANSPESAFLGKRISYLACDDTDTLILILRFTLHERRFTCILFPFNRGRRLRTDIVYHPVHAFHFIDDPV